MTTLRESTRLHIDDALLAGAVCVFPAEVSVGFWRLDTLERIAAAAELSSGGRTHFRRAAIRSDLFISWDTFKERSTRSHVERTPTNRASRTLFSYSLLAENARRPFLQRVVPTGYAEASARFVETVVRGLPGLGPLVSSESFELLPDALRHDLRELKRRYDTFLDERSLFEPGWAFPSVDTGGKRYRIFFPELLEDYSEFEAAISATDSVSIVRLPRPPAPAERPDGPDSTGPDIDAEPAGPQVVAEYADTGLEIVATLDRIEALLLAGTPADRIVLTVGNLPECRDELVREAMRRGLPVGLRAGVPLADHPAGRVFRLIQACVDQRFAPDALKRLVLSGSVPWTDERGMHLLVRFGLEHGCLSTARFDAWKAALEAGGSHSFRALLESEGRTLDQLSALFASVRSALTALVTARTFEDVRTALYGRLFGAIIDADRFSATIEPVFQRCITTLTDWIDAERTTGLAPAQPYRLFAASLQEVVYVRPADRSGVAVYPYRVTAGIVAEHHFVIGMSREALRVPVVAAPFLRVDEREKVGLADRDLSEEFLAAYVLGGEHTVLSYARTSHAGAQLAPPLAVEKASLPPGRYARERRFWTGPEFAPAEQPALDLSPTRRSNADTRPSPTAHLYEQQVAGFQTAQRRQIADRVDRRRDPFVAGTRPYELLRRKLTSSGQRSNAPPSNAPPGDNPPGAETSAQHDRRLRVPVTGLDALHATPFGFLLQKVVGVQELRCALCFEDPFSLGSFEHELVFWVNRQLHDSVLQSWREVVSEEALAAQLSARLRTQMRRESPMPQLVLGMFAERVLAGVVHALDAQAALFPEARPARLESSLSFDVGDSVILTGRIDALHTYGAGRFIIIDYKRGDGSIPGAAMLRNLERVQIPVYRLMASERGMHVVDGCYISVEGVETVAVFGGSKPAIDDEKWPDIRKELSQRVLRLAERVTRGNYTCRATGGCDECPTRSICRAKYTHRGESARREVE